VTQRENREYDNRFELFSELEVPVKIEIAYSDGDIKCGDIFDKVR
jgi:hypothetical protein